MFLKKRNISMLSQIAILFVVGVFAVGALSSFTMYIRTLNEVNRQITTASNATAVDLESYIKQFPFHE